MIGKTIKDKRYDSTTSFIPDTNIIVLFLSMKELLESGCYKITLEIEQELIKLYGGIIPKELYKLMFESGIQKIRKLTKNFNLKTGLIDDD